MPCGRFTTIMWLTFWNFFVDRLRFPYHFNIALYLGPLVDPPFSSFLICFARAQFNAQSKKTETGICCRCWFVRLLVGLCKPTAAACCPNVNGVNSFGSFQSKKRKLKLFAMARDPLDVLFETQQNAKSLVIGLDQEIALSFKWLDEQLVRATHLFQNEPTAKENEPPKSPKRRGRRG